MKNSRRQKCSLERWKESRSRDTLVCLSLYLNLVILYQCLPLAGPYRKWEPGQCIPKGMRCRQNKGNRCKKKKKRQKIFPSIWVFFSESDLRIRWPKFWGFSSSKIQQKT